MLISGILDNNIKERPAYHARHRIFTVIVGRLIASIYFTKPKSIKSHVDDFGCIGGGFGHYFCGLAIC